MLLDNTTDQIVRRVLSRYLRPEPLSVADAFSWVDIIGKEEACYLLAELNREFGTKLFPTYMTEADVERINTVGKLIAYIEEKIRG